MLRGPRELPGKQSGSGSLSVSFQYATLNAEMLTPWQDAGPGFYSTAYHAEPLLPSGECLRKGLCSPPGSPGTENHRLLTQDITESSTHREFEVGFGNGPISRTILVTTFGVVEDLRL